MKKKPVYKIVPVADLKAHPENPRKHSPAELKALGESVKRFGFTSPIVVQKSSGLVLAGHARLEVLRSQKAAEAPVIELDCNDQDAAAYMIADNQLTILGAWDFSELEGLIDGLKKLDYDGMEFLDMLDLPELEAEVKTSDIEFNDIDNPIEIRLFVPKPEKKNIMAMLKEIQNKIPGVIIQ